MLHSHYCLLKLRSAIHFLKWRPVNSLQVLNGISLRIRFWDDLSLSICRLSAQQSYGCSFNLLAMERSVWLNSRLVNRLTLSILWATASRFLVNPIQIKDSCLSAAALEQHRCFILERDWKRFRFSTLFLIGARSAGDLLQQRAVSGTRRSVRYNWRWFCRRKGFVTNHSVLKKEFRSYLFLRTKTDDDSCGSIRGFEKGLIAKSHWENKMACGVRSLSLLCRKRIKEGHNVCVCLHRGQCLIVRNDAWLN